MKLLLLLVLLLLLTGLHMAYEGMDMGIDLGRVNLHFEPYK